MPRVVGWSRSSCHVPALIKDQGELTVFLPIIHTSKTCLWTQNDKSNPPKKRISSETQDSAEWRDISIFLCDQKYDSTGSFKNLHLLLSLKNLPPDCHWTLSSESWTLFHSQGSVAKSIRLLDSIATCLRPAQTSII